MSFYNNFLSLCNSVNKSPSRVVLEAGLKKPAVTRWKSGGNPTDASLQKLAEYFQVPISALTDEEKKKPVPIGNEPNIEDLINNMSREELIEFIMLATARLKDME